MISIRETARVFTIGSVQAVRLPPEYHFEEREVYIRRDAATGDVILSRRPAGWESFFALDAVADVPADFMTEEDRQQGGPGADPFEPPKSEACLAGGAPIS